MGPLYKIGIVLLKLGNTILWGDVSFAETTFAISFFMIPLTLAYIGTKMMSFIEQMKS